MAITCPHCKKVIQFKGVKPGKFTPKCPQCNQTFSLTVSADDPPKIAVALLKAPAKGPPASETPPVKKASVAPKPAAAEKTQPGAAGPGKSPATKPALKKPEPSAEVDPNTTVAGPTPKAEPTKKPVKKEVAAPASKAPPKAALKPAPEVAPKAAPKKPAPKKSTPPPEEDPDSTVAGSRGAASEADEDPDIAAMMDSAVGNTTGAWESSNPATSEDEAVGERTEAGPTEEEEEAVGERTEAIPTEEEDEEVGQQTGAFSKDSEVGDQTAADSSAEDAERTGAFESPAAADKTGAWSSDEENAEDADKTGAFETEDADRTGAFATEDANRTGAFESGDADRTGAFDNSEQQENRTVAPDKGAKTKAATKGGAKKRASAKDFVMPEKLGGYQIVKELGRGGMGAVFMARQVSLDRSVAIKIMNPEWASDAIFVARFTREAYAAAQLVHHNVVQIYDIGFEQDIHFFSMEFVKGRSLGDLLKKDGKLAAEVAVGYVLQAARGLKFAHDQGMIHRDIKPDNLMINDQGIVKVADLGLVKTPGAIEEESKESASPPPSLLAASAGITQANVTVGTPAYMSPEQARSAASVDLRADIYSLGCTLYVLITGKQPFVGKTILEILSKHAQEPVVPPEVVVKRVPKSLSGIIVKMMAKNPADRQSDMSEVIQSLEKWMGIQSSGPFTPKEEHADKLEECVNKFNSVGTAKLKPLVFAGLFGFSILMVLLCAVLGWTAMAGGFLGLPILTTLSYFIVGGIAGKTFLFRKVREFVLGSSITDWLMWTLGLLIFLVILYLFNLLFIWIGFLIVAVGLAFGIYYGLDRTIASQRAAPIKETEVMLRNMRLNGLEEESLRQFVCKYSGNHWEAFFESLFGYEGKIQAREKWGTGDDDRRRPRYGAWRDSVVLWIDNKQKARREARERKLLRKLEQKQLEAKGVNAAEARKQADLAAEAMVARAAELREAAPDESGRKTNLKDFLKAAEKPQSVTTSPRGNPIAGFVNFFLGARPRFLAGALLLAACVFWMNQNNLMPGQDIKAAAAQGVESGNIEQLSVLTKYFKAETKPLRVPIVGMDLPEELFNVCNPGVAGLILIFSAFFRGVKPYVFMVPAAALAFFGHLLPIPELPVVAVHHVSAAAGAILGLLGFVILWKWR